MSGCVSHGQRVYCTLERYQEAVVAYEQALAENSSLPRVRGWKRLAWGSSLIGPISSATFAESYQFAFKRTILDGRGGRRNSALCPIYLTRTMGSVESRRGRGGLGRGVGALCRPFALH